MAEIAGFGGIAAAAINRRRIFSVRVHAQYNKIIRGCERRKYFPFVHSSSFERLLTQSTIFMKGGHQGSQPQNNPRKM
jgi:hypothetical protein